jgi:hypothetical protein
MIQIELAFPHEFTCEALDELPASPAVYHFDTHKKLTRDGLIVRVSPVVAKPWIGVFAFEQDQPTSVNRILSMPDPRQICVVSKGAGYVVNVENPHEWEEIDMRPIQAICIAVSDRLVVFAGDTDYWHMAKQVSHGARSAWHGMDSES